MTGIRTTTEIFVDIADHDHGPDPRHAENLNDVHERSENAEGKLIDLRIAAAAVSAAA